MIDPNEPLTILATRKLLPPDILQLSSHWTTLWFVCSGHLTVSIPLTHLYRHNAFSWRAGCTGANPIAETGAEVNCENRWIVNGLRIDERGQLVIDAAPGCGNRKRWDGEMEFHLPEGMLDTLMEQLQERKTDERMIEVARCEMKEFIELFKADYHDKKQTLAKQLNIDIQDVPLPHWYSMESAGEPIQFSKYRL